MGGNMMGLLDAKVPAPAWAGPLASGCAMV
jgi:hypothetical protein